MTREFKTKFFFGACIAVTVMAVCLLFVVMGYIFYRGLPAISLEFLTARSTNFGRDGGIFYQAVGTFILISVAGLLALPVAIGSAIYQSEYLGQTGRDRVNLLTYALNAVPTIIFGLFGYLFFGVFLKLGVSWLTGSFILAIMIIPTIIVSTRDAIESIPVKYREAGLALGLTREKLIETVILPQSLHGIITGLLLGLARALGETAAIMFTATTFSGMLIPRSFHDPVSTLQTHILVLAQEAVNPKTLTNAWGAALVLVLFVMTMSIVSMIMRTKLTQESER